MSDHYEEIKHLAELISEMIDEIKILNLNLTVANAKLRMTDPAFEVVGRSFNELVDTAAVSSEEASIALKKLRGDKLSDEEARFVPKSLDTHLDKIEKSAEYLIRTVTALKKNQQLGKTH